MNFLAHIYLSQKNDDLLIGNFIADFIKGNQYRHYPESIQNGIYLHRQIDSFTDTHSIVKKSKRRLHERYGHYDGIIIDILYDHFLAKNWDTYDDDSLIETEQYFLELLDSRLKELPEKVQHIIPYMKMQKWLSSYATLEGIEKALTGVNRRTKGKSRMHLAINDLHEHYEDLENDFTLFFKELIDFSKNIISKF